MPSSTPSATAPGGENARGANEAVSVPDLVAQAGVYVETIARLLSVA